jgi:hypothetical protein
MRLLCRRGCGIFLSLCLLFTPAIVYIVRRMGTNQQILVRHTTRGENPVINYQPLSTQELSQVANQLYRNAGKQQVAGHINNTSSSLHNNHIENVDLGRHRSLATTLSCSCWTLYRVTQPSCHVEGEGRQGGEDSSQCGKGGRASDMQR